MENETYKTLRFNLPVEFRHGDRTGFSFVSSIDGEHLTGYYPSGTLAKKNLRRQLEQEIQECFEAKRNCQRRFIGCSGGTVFIVEFRYGTWGYSIIGGIGRKYTSGVQGFSSLDEALDKARSHAEAFGGMLWEHS